LLELLSQRCVIPSTTASSQATPIGRITEDYTSYLRQQRNLSDATVVGYLPFIRRFLMDRFGPGPIDFSALCAADVIGFMSRQAARLIAKRAKTATSALRSFLGYLRYRGEIQCDLAAVVPTVPIWSMTGIPRAIAASDANAALAHCRRDTPVGCRDYAILLLLARLGLRAGEIVSLTLDSINWAAGSLTVTGKRGQPELLPLPSDVGEAIANYLQRGRPKKSGHRALFLRAQAPVRGFNGPSAVSCVVRHPLERAGIDSPRKGAHQFRHALACQMLRQGPH
jgi:integrase/recombinase XerD